MELMKNHKSHWKQYEELLADFQDTITSKCRYKYQMNLKLRKALQLWHTTWNSYSLKEHHFREAQNRWSSWINEGGHEGSKNNSFQRFDVILFHFLGDSIAFIISFFCKLFLPFRILGDSPHVFRL